MEKKPFSERFSLKNKIPLKKTIATFLIFLLIFSQTIRLDFFGTAHANATEYRDIISIIVDKKTNQSLSREIQQYAKDIQGKLSSTQVVISVINENTTPAQIAAYNEKLYYEGNDESGVKSRLVGTILIGNIPLPMVSAEGKYFPSIFPYVDFEHKTFLYNNRSDRYEKVSALQSGNQAVEIWHGVINPAVGRDWQGDSDISLIKNFLEKVHLYYTKQGRFAPTNEPPRVFYFDGFAESMSMDPRAIFQYALRVKNAENLAYNRFSKYLLSDINTALKQYDQKNSTDYTSLLSSLGMTGVTNENMASNTLSDEVIKTTPDIQTAPIIQQFLQNYSQIFNSKILGEELAAVHNAGRYTSGATVNADL